MPIEIREIVIKTEITSTGYNNVGIVKEKELNILKKQLLEECKRMISERSQKQSYKR